MRSDWDRRLDSERNCFDALRLALATLVVFEHSYFLPINSPATEPLFRFSGGQTNFGSLAVQFFFVISGFLIVRSWETTGSTLRYLQKRVARIIPGFILASCAGVVIGALSAHDIGAYVLGINPSTFLAKMLSLHQADPPNAFPDNPMRGIVTGTLWSIRYEFDCYLIVALLGVLGWLRPGPVAIIFVALCGAYAAQRWGKLDLPIWDHGIPYFLISSPEKWPQLFTYFFAGASFYLWRNHIPRSPFVFATAIITVGIALRCGGAEPVLITAGSYCVFFVSLSFAATPRIVGERVDLSYGTYLFGFPIQQLIISFWPQPVPPLPLFLTSFGATCVIAYLSWKFIESPSLRWKWPRWLSRAPASPRVIAPTRDVSWTASDAACIREDKMS
jgi:peptidoglycan/LPS O-acetylase OafA/YrhL